MTGAYASLRKEEDMEFLVEFEIDRRISLSERKRTTMDLLTTAKELADRVESESVKQNVPTSALIRMHTADLVPFVQPGAERYPLLAVSGGRYSAIG
jgi:hypothetical protein